MSANSQPSQLPPAIVVVPSNDEAFSRSQGAMEVLRKEQHGFHNDFLGPWDHALDVDSPCFPSIQRVIERHPEKDVLYALRFDESCPEPSYDSLGTCRGWVLGFVGVDSLPHRRIHGVLGIIPKPPQPRNDNFRKAMTLGFDVKSGLPTLHASPKVRLEVLDCEQWRPIQWVPDTEGHLQEILKQPGKLYKWFIHSKITKIRLFGRLEYEIRVESRLPNEMVEQRDSYLEAGSGEESIAPLCRSMLPPPGSKIGNLIALSPIRAELNLEASTAVVCLTGEIVRLAKLWLRTPYEEKSLLELRDFYTSPKVSILVSIYLDIR